MIETLVREIGEGEMKKNVVWKWRKCSGKVEGDGDRNPVCK